MTLNCYYEIYFADNYLTSHCHRHIVDALEKEYPDITFNRINNAPMKCHANDKFGYHSLIIENDDTKKYISVTYLDKVRYMQDPGRNWDLDNCVDVYASCGVHEQDFWYEPIDDFKVKPFTYSVSTKEMLKALDKHQGIEKKMPDKLPFRGKLYNYRNFLSKDDRFNVVDGYKNANDYALEMSSNTINLSLNGVGETCQRDMEILAAGTALFREKLNPQFHNPLIPNHHYIAVDCDHIKHIRNEHKYYNAQAEVYLERWSEVKDDRELIEFVAKNGKEWYEANGRPEQHGEVAVAAIDLKALIKEL